MSNLDLKAIGEKVVKANQEGSYKSLLDDIYHENCVSAESAAMPGGEQAVTGKQAIAGKWAWWEDNHTVHDVQATGPFVHGDDRFGVIFSMDVTHKPSSNRTQMQELAVYTVKGGQIVREEFFN